MKTILVTGGLGFIGSNFIRMLLQEDVFEKVINLDKQTYAGNPENLSGFQNHPCTSFNEVIFATKLLSRAS